MTTNTIMFTMEAKYVNPLNRKQRHNVDDPYTNFIKLLDSIMIENGYKEYEFDYARYVGHTISDVSNKLANCLMVYLTFE